MSDLGASLEQRSAVLLRRGPYPLLALATAISAYTMPEFDRGWLAWTTVLVLVVAIAAGHLVVVDRRWGTGTGPDRLSTGYLAARALAALVLTVVNPFFAVFAFIGFMDTFVHARPRWVTPLVLVTAVSMAGSQSGGLPPEGPLQLVVFGGLLTLNAGLALFFVRVGQDEERLADQRVATIGELEATNARLAETLAENADLHAELLQRARDAGRHEERERLALEIHDTIAQSLVAVLTQLQAAAGDVDPGRRIGAATELARAALVDARRSVQALMPAELDDADGPAALARLVQDWVTRTGGHAELVVTGTPQAVPAEAETVLLRVAGEALSNVARHAGACRVGVTLSFMADEVTLDVRDDGVGMTVREEDGSDDGGGGPVARFGLRGMRQRAERVGGQVVVESGPGLGTAVSLRLPLRPRLPGRARVGAAPGPGVRGG